MDPRLAKWEEIDRERRFGVPALQDPTFLPCMSNVRIRTEHGARDSINSRAWDFFHATPPTQVHSEGLRTKNAPVHMDMNPINTRSNTVQYRIQQQYMPDPVRGPTTASDMGIPPAPGPTPAPPTSFSGNGYTQRMDAGGADARNMMRELRGAVVEDNRERQIDASRHLAERQFDDRWLPVQTAADASALQAYELLRPKQDDWRDQ